MSTGHTADSVERQVQSTVGNADFRKGKWFCECHIAARCLTATKNSAHHGEKFWRCANVENRRCSFFLWIIHEAAAKDWLKSSRPDLKFETAKNAKSSDQDAAEKETPFTKAKKRRKAPMDATKESEIDDDNGLSSTGSRDPFFTPKTPKTSEKVAPASILSTPTRRFAEKLRLEASPLFAPNPQPLPATNNRAPIAERLGASLILDQKTGKANSGLEEDSSLTTTVLGLIGSDNIQLKPSTEIQIRHEIDLVVDVGKAKILRYEETISELHQRVDELEKMILHLTE